MRREMKRCECGLKCELCNLPADYADSIPDASIPSGHSRSECGYRLQPLCWIHAVDRRGHNTSRVQPIVRCESAGVGRLDGGRASGDCVCFDCGREFRRHPKCEDAEYLNVLCSGEVVKL